MGKDGEFSFHFISFGLFCFRPGGKVTRAILSILLHAASLRFRTSDSLVYGYVLYGMDGDAVLCCVATQRTHMHMHAFEYLIALVQNVTSY